MKVRLTADSSGRLNGVYLNDRPISFSLEARVPLQPLREEIIGIIGDDRGPGSYQEQAEIELDCDYGLHYAHVIDAITAVYGYTDPTTRDVIKLVEKINFAEPRAP